MGIPLSHPPPPLVEVNGPNSRVLVPAPTSTPQHYTSRSAQTYPPYPPHPTQHPDPYHDDRYGYGYDYGMNYGYDRGPGGGGGGAKGRYREEPGYERGRGRERERSRMAGGRRPPMYVPVDEPDRRGGYCGGGAGGGYGNPYPTPPATPRHYDPAYPHPGNGVPMGAYAVSPLSPTPHQPPPAHQHPPATHTHPPPHHPGGINPTAQEWIPGDPYLDACVCGTTCTCRKGYRVLYRQRHDNGNTEAGEIRYVAKDQVGRNCDGSGEKEKEKEKERKRKKKEKKEGVRDGGPSRAEVADMAYQLKNLQHQIGEMTGRGGDGMDPPPAGMGMKAGPRPEPPRGGPPYGATFPDEMMMDPRLSGYPHRLPKPPRDMGGRFGAAGGRPDGPDYGMSDMGDEYGSEIGVNGMMGGMEPEPYGKNPRGRRRRESGPGGMAGMPRGRPFGYEPLDFAGGADPRTAFGGLRPEPRIPGGNRRRGMGMGMGMPGGIHGLGEFPSPMPFNQPKPRHPGGKKGGKKARKPAKETYPFAGAPVMDAHMNGGPGPAPDAEGQDAEGGWEDEMEGMEELAKAVYHEPEQQEQQGHMAGAGGGENMFGEGGPGPGSHPSARGRPSHHGSPGLQGGFGPGPRPSLGQRPSHHSGQGFGQSGRPSPEQTRQSAGNGSGVRNMGYEAPHVEDGPDDGIAGF